MSTCDTVRAIDGHMLSEAGGDLEPSSLEALEELRLVTRRTTQGPTDHLSHTKVETGGLDSPGGGRV